VLFKAYWGFPLDLVEFEAAPLDRSEGNQAIFDRQPFGIVDFPAYVEDLFSDPEGHRLTEMDYWWYGRLVEHFESLLAAPVVIRDELYGALVLYYAETHVFSEEDKRLLASLADQSALAIENARLRVQAEQAAVAEERNRIARELHDSVSQALYGIGLGARTARTMLDRSELDAATTEKLASPLDYVLSLADAGLAEMRALIFELRPDALANEGLVAALERHAAVVRTRHKLAVALDLCDEPDVSLEVKEALYRIAQEALNNAVKHAGAAQVRIRLAREDGALLLEIGDDGAGFDPSLDYPGHLGLASMEERAERHGGSLEIESAPGAGTTIRARLPVPSGDA
jgi:signal transduction histidine kinase